MAMPSAAASGTFVGNIENACGKNRRSSMQLQSQRLAADHHGGGRVGSAGCCSISSRPPSHGETPGVYLGEGDESLQEGVAVSSRIESRTDRCHSSTAERTPTLPRFLIIGCDLAVDHRQFRPLTPVLPAKRRRKSGVQLPFRGNSPNQISSCAAP